MSGPLNSIFAACESLITPNLAVFSIVPTYGHSGAERNEGRFPRVVWVPTAEDIGPARGQGGDIVVDGQGGMNLPGGAQDPIFTRISTVEVDIWAPDRDTCETMINCVVSAVRDTLSDGSFGITRAQWLMPGDSNRDGETYRISFQFQIPIIRVRLLETTAVVNTLPITPQFVPIVGT